MKSKHKKTLQAIYRRPTGGGIEALLVALGATIEEREGSRIAIIFPHLHPAVYHRPHPSPNTDKGAVASLRKWLNSMGITAKMDTKK